MPKVLAGDHQAENTPNGHDHGHEDQEHAGEVIELGEHTTKNQEYAEPQAPARKGTASSLPTEQASRNRVRPSRFS